MHCFLKILTKTNELTHKHSYFGELKLHNGTANFKGILNRDGKREDHSLEEATILTIKSGSSNRFVLYGKTKGKKYKWDVWVT